MHIRSGHATLTSAPPLAPLTCTTGWCQPHGPGRVDGLTLVRVTMEVRAGGCRGAQRGGVCEAAVPVAAVHVSATGTVTVERASAGEWTGVTWHCSRRRGGSRRSHGQRYRLIHSRELRRQWLHLLSLPLHYVDTPYPPPRRRCRQGMPLATRVPTPPCKSKWPPPRGPPRTGVHMPPWTRQAQWHRPALVVAAPAAAA